MNTLHENNPPGEYHQGPYASYPRFITLDAALEHKDQGPLMLACKVTRFERVKRGPLMGQCRATLVDLKGSEQLATYPFDLPQLRKAAMDAARLGTRMMAVCHFPTYPKSDPRHEDGSLRLELLDLVPLTRPTSMLAPAPDVAEQVQRDLDRILSGQAGVTLRQHILTTVHDRLRIASASRSPRFQLAEEMLLLQALSQGQVDSDALNSRLSIFLFSNSGTGKTKLGEMARLLAPVSKQIQPGLITVPGLAATVTRRDGEWSAQPGVAPDCSGGIIHFDDFHRTEDRLRKQMQAILMNVAEEGRIHLQKAGAQDYEAKAALFITTNRLSMCDGRVVIDGDGDQEDSLNRAAELVMPWDFASRIDLMQNLATDDNAVRSAMEIAVQEARREGGRRDETYPSRAGATEQEVQDEYLKVLIATVLERIPVVDLDPVDGPLQQTVAKLGVVLREQGARLRGKDEENFDGAGLIRRMSNSLRKLVGALARLDGRAVATVADVKRAAELLIPKIEVVRYICRATDRVRPINSLDELLEQALIASDDRWEEIVLGFGGQKVTAGQIGAKLGYGERAVRRELVKRGISGEEGWYVIPTEYRRPRGRPDVSDLSAELVDLPPEQDVASGLKQAPKDEHKFNDCLVEVPDELRESVEAASELFGEEKIALEVNLAKVAATEDPQYYLYHISGAVRAIRDAVPEYRQGEALRAWLGVLDWEQRRVRAVSFWVAAMGLDLLATQFVALRERYGAPQGPDPIAAYVARQKWQAEQDLAAYRAENPRQEVQEIDPAFLWSNMRPTA